ncbi:hypothetical protein GCM10007862_04000 [Dyella lipolytica]|nr:hypothetical protein GCM10007862_04000 [Dyella lipolytica]
MSPIDDMDAHPAIVAAALAAKSNAETPKNACWEIRSEVMRVKSPDPRLHYDNDDGAQLLLYSS